MIWRVTSLCYSVLAPAVGGRDWPLGWSGRGRWTPRSWFSGYWCRAGASVVAAEPHWYSAVLNLNTGRTSQNINYTRWNKCNFFNFKYSGTLYTSTCPLNILSIFERTCPCIFHVLLLNKHIIHVRVCLVFIGKKPQFNANLYHNTSILYVALGKSELFY